jgi:hypothetical protein
VHSKVGTVSDYGVICANPRAQKAAQTEHFQLTSASHHLKIIYAIVRLLIIFDLYHGKSNDDNVDARLNCRLSSKFGHRLVQERNEVSSVVK